MKILTNVFSRLMIVVFIVIISGCNMLGSPYCTETNKRTYYNINLKNGIDSKEAIIIAQRVLLNSKYSNDYYVSEPLLGNDEKYNLWGVSFKPKKSGYDKCGYTVMINKTSGEIKDGCYSGL